MVAYLVRRQVCRKMSAHEHPRQALSAKDGKAPGGLFELYRFEPTARLFDAVEAGPGKLDALVTNAGLAVSGVVADLTEQAFHKQPKAKARS
jgi:NAD(P)-dependent dehydrogenase (short-subunit alcohol dehydrogenase family)